MPGSAYTRRPAAELVKLYHRTTAARATTILRTGFGDATGTISASLTALKRGAGGAGGGSRKSGTLPDPSDGVQNGD